MKRARSMTRFVIVMAATMAAILGLAMAIGDAHPLMALGLTVVICIIVSAVLPSAPWVRFTDGIRQIAQALGWRGLRLPRGAVILTVCIACCIAVDTLVFPRSTPAGLALLGLLLAACVAALWCPEWAWLADWRERVLTERFWNRRLRAMDAHDREAFSGKGIPRKDWARFLDELAGVLREMRASEDRES